MLGAAALCAVLAGGTAEVPPQVWEWFKGPEAKDFRMQRIHRQPGEDAWPFAHDEGYLMCTRSQGRALGLFVPVNAQGDLPEGVTSGVLLSGNPFEMLPFYLAMPSVFRKMADLQVMIRLIAPFAETAKRLCTLPKGTVLEKGEL
ncbi:MAG: hypothetical protein KDJ73_11440 [Notoacmeibacter sp.]|nr:hypothetical protein [Notoacmeibacter sp.]MCC0032904.1 hypothetical protein [Brucellaceae bacterium]